VGTFKKKDGKGGVCGFLAICLARPKVKAFLWLHVAPTTSHFTLDKAFLKHEVTPGTLLIECRQMQYKEEISWGREGKTGVAPGIERRGVDECSTGGTGNGARQYS